MSESLFEEKRTAKLKTKSVKTTYSVPSAKRCWMGSKARIDAVDGIPWWTAILGFKSSDVTLPCGILCWNRNQFLKNK